MSQTSDYQSAISSAPDMNFSDWHWATGPLAIPMTNDYLFRVLLQRNNYVLKGLICSLLHLTLTDIKSAVQIRLLDFTLFHESLEFYSTYQFINVKKHTIYSDKIQLSVLNLTRIELATEEDKIWGLDQWASLFKSDTWEELKMLARNNEFMNEASATTYQLTQDEYIRMQCEAREDYYRRRRSVQSMIEEQEHTVRQLESENAALQRRLADALKLINSIKNP